jgi:Flp pilus assembly protein TadG
MTIAKRIKNRGSVIIYVLAGMTALTGVVSLAVDAGHVRLVKVQLQDAADAAARAGARVLSSGVTAVQNAVVAEAATATADGNSVVVSPSTDIVFGTWSNGTFTALSGNARSNANAIQVTCAHTAARGNAVHLYFASLLGMTSSDVSTSTIAQGTAKPAAGFIGYTGITANGATFFGGYNSGTTTTPTQSSCDTNARVGTNGCIQGTTSQSNQQYWGNNWNWGQGNSQNSCVLSCDAVLGPSASTSNCTCQGSNVYCNSALPTVTMPTCPSCSNPNSTPQNYTCNSTTTLPGGTYYFTSLTVNANLTFSGPAQVYVNGNITVGATCCPSSGVPTDLTIYQYGNNTFTDGSSGNSNNNNWNQNNNNSSSSGCMNLTAKVVAPTCSFSTQNSCTFAGAGVFSSMSTQSSSNFYYDEAAGPCDGSCSVCTCQ